MISLAKLAKHLDKSVGAVSQWVRRYNADHPTAPIPTIPGAVGKNEFERAWTESLKGVRR